MWQVYVVMFIVLVVVALLWANGIDYMHKNHPDYKGDDFLGGFDFDDKEEEKNKKNIKKD